jgi:hypothetical protein
MGLMDSLQALFGRAKAANQAVAEDVEEAVEEEVAIERLQDDIEAERLAAVERAIDTPSSMDEER